MCETHSLWAPSEMGRRTGAALSLDCFFDEALAREQRSRSRGLFLKSHTSWTFSYHQIDKII